MTVYASNTNAQTFEYQGGDLGYVPKIMPARYREHGHDEAALSRALAGAPLRTREKRRTYTRAPEDQS